MLGRLPLTSLVGAVLGSLAFAAASRWMWLRSIGRYTSASS
jgi:ABC-2 type transport system permease protein